jgi:hypothetical protein
VKSSDKTDSNLSSDSNSNTSSKKYQQKYSLVLSDFSPEEMEKAVRKRLPETAAASILTQLRAPTFLALRNPF